MILPIGHQERSVRRLPWVTLSLIAACFVVFLFTDTAALEDEPGASDYFEEAADYWRQRAYLEPHPKIREHVAYDVMPNQRRQYLLTLPDLSPYDPWEDGGREAQQAELDRLTDLALGVTPVAPEAASAFERWGLVPASPRAHAFLSYMFLHADWLHLLGNLFMLFLAGPPIEDRYGRLVFAGFYVLAGVFAAVFYLGMVGQSPIPMVGASGAIAGVLGAFLVRLWSTKIRFAYFFLFGFKPYFGTFEAPAWAMLSLWFGNEVLQGWVWDSVGLAGGIAYWAHVGGFLFGVGAALGVRALKVEERWIDPAVEARLTHFSANPVLEEAMAARERGELDEALALLEAEWQRAPEDAIAVAFWDVALACAQPERARHALRAALESSARGGELEIALRHWSELSDHVPSELLDPALLLRFLPTLVEENQRERAKLALRQALHPENRRLTPGVALRAVELARELDPPSALRAARLALASPDLHEAKRARLEAVCGELAAAGVEEVASAGEVREDLPPEVAAPSEPPSTPVWDASGAIDLSRFGRAKLIEARPRRLDADGLRLGLEGGREAAVAYARIQAVSVALVGGLGPKPVLVIDLLANWNASEAEVLQGVRLRSDRFDPRPLLASPGDPTQAFVRLVGRLLEASRAQPLPSVEAATGQPFARFDSLEEYENQVLQVAEP